MIDFVKTHPNLIVQRFDLPNRRVKYNEEWQTLAEMLNALGAGQKTVGQWQLDEC